ncbi:receptor-like protein Cf-9 [Humulus lupulus]|uniref:receptor-like protein Cf-9 n=1 Tax=Humulus lupulus TaxID=3486 RepID=UPI002B40AF22|nr:receptor-like protein Cf-9 [Humulus lupulus]
MGHWGSLRLKRWGGSNRVWHHQNWCASGLCRHRSSVALWNEKIDCCTWEEISCDVFGNVIVLDLSCGSLQGTISSNSTLFKLHHLKDLQLFGNDFRGSFIVSEFGKFKNMTFLDLSDSNFSGQVPLEISHLSKLVILGLGGPKLDGYLRYKVMVGENTFKALSQNLTSLKDFSLNGIDLSSIPPMLSFKNFSSLTGLDLRQCKLHGKQLENIFLLSKLQSLFLRENEAPNGSFPRSNWSSALEYLDIYNNTFFIDLPLLLKNIPKSLSILYLSFSNLVGPLPDNIHFLAGSAPNFIGLDLSNNLLNGTILSWIYAIPYLEDLYLSHNQFTGEIIGGFQSPSLQRLDLSSNKLSGTLELEKLLNFKSFISYCIGVCALLSSVL